MIQRPIGKLAHEQSPGGADQPRQLQSRRRRRPRREPGELRAEPMMWLHQPTAQRKRPANCRPFAKRLMGFEPTTFCMASRTWGHADCLDIPAKIGGFTLESRRRRCPAFTAKSREFPD